jgi:hypothetical protein
MSWWMPFASIGLGIVLPTTIIFFVDWYVLDRLWPRKPWWDGLKPDLPRRHLESFRAWERRHAEAMRDYNEAERAFMQSPDASYTQVSTRGFVASLPINHPLSVKRVAALYPEGPPYNLLAQLAGVKPKDMPN